MVCDLFATDSLCAISISARVTCGKNVSGESKCLRSGCCWDWFSKLPKEKRCYQKINYAEIGDDSSIVVSSSQVVDTPGTSEKTPSSKQVENNASGSHLSLESISQTTSHTTHFGSMSTSMQLTLSIVSLLSTSDDTTCTETNENQLAIDQTLVMNSTTNLSSNASSKAIIVQDKANSTVTEKLHATNMETGLGLTPSSEPTNHIKKEDILVTGSTLTFSGEPTNHTESNISPASTAASHFTTSALGDISSAEVAISTLTLFIGTVPNASTVSEIVSSSIKFSTETTVTGNASSTITGKLNTTTKEDFSETGSTLTASSELITHTESNITQASTAASLVASKLSTSEVSSDTRTVSDSHLNTPVTETGFKISTASVISNHSLGKLTEITIAGSASSIVAEKLNTTKEDIFTESIRSLTPLSEAVSQSYMTETTAANKPSNVSSAIAASKPRNFIVREYGHSSTRRLSSHTRGTVAESSLPSHYSVSFMGNISKTEESFGNITVPSISGSVKPTLGSSTSVSELTLHTESFLTETIAMSFMSSFASGSLRTTEGIPVNATNFNKSSYSPSSAVSGMTVEVSSSSSLSYTETSAAKIVGSTSVISHISHSG